MVLLLPPSSINPPSDADSVRTEAIAADSLLYYHYLVDAFDDRGWGCGYRALQTICAWLRLHLPAPKQSKEPSVRDVQALFVQWDMKPPAFASSRDWIGSPEVWMCIDWLYDVPCRILSLGSGAELHQAPAQNKLAAHFAKFRCPIFCGGDRDSMAKTIAGIRISSSSPCQSTVLVLVCCCQSLRWWQCRACHPFLCVFIPSVLDRAGSSLCSPRRLVCNGTGGAGPVTRSAGDPTGAWLGGMEASDRSVCRRVHLQPLLPRTRVLKAHDVPRQSEACEHLFRRSRLGS
eukprot:m.146351 g.146351  ORF g.146351 m.146351 type:complete len:289 (-) comp10090_c0_seq11:450-1316(-)